MKRKISILMLAALCVIAALSFGCKKPDSQSASQSDLQSDSQSDSQSAEKLADITGVSFSNAEFTYDGAEKSITVDGVLPEGVDVVYSNNKATDAGVYDATATMSGKGYNTLTLEASLSIAKAELTGLSLADGSALADGEVHTPEISGSLPSGVSVKFTFNGTALDGVKALGTYEVVAEIYGKNYKT